MADLQFGDLKGKPYVPVEKMGNNVVVKNNVKRESYSHTVVEEFSPTAFTTSKRLLALIVILLCVVFVFQSVTFDTQGGIVQLQPKTFSSLLEYIQTCPEVKVPFINTENVQLGDWGPFNFLRDFVQTFLQIVNFVIFLVNALLSVVTLIVWVVSWIFTG